MHTRNWIKPKAGGGGDTKINIKTTVKTFILFPVWYGKICKTYTKPYFLRVVQVYYIDFNIGGRNSLVWNKNKKQGGGGGVCAFTVPSARPWSSAFPSGTARVGS